MTLDFDKHRLLPAGHGTRKLADALLIERYQLVGDSHEAIAHGCLCMAAAYTSTGRRTKVDFVHRRNLTRGSSYGRSP